MAESYTSVEFYGKILKEWERLDVLLWSFGEGPGRGIANTSRSTCRREELMRVESEGYVRDGEESCECCLEFLRVSSRSKFRPNPFNIGSSP